LERIARFPAPDPQGLKAPEMRPKFLNANLLSKTFRLLTLTQEKDKKNVTMNITIIPAPVSAVCTGGVFQCGGMPLLESCGEFEKEAVLFKEQMTGVFSGCDRKTKIILKQNRAKNEVSDEAYKLVINAGVIAIEAAASAGAYRALQSLRQLLLSRGQEGGIACASIDDYPRFPWRGFMLDTSRYFYSVDFIKKILDVLSMHHINIFHWHLNDDQGWRLPVTAYPLLTEIGSRRRDHRHRDRVTGGFYSRDDIKDVVAFAASRHIEAVPEIDLPGHASAILAAYPELGCTGGPYRVEDRFGIFDDVLCAGNDGIWDLAAAAFDSLAELFPSKYVHIGGDEVRFVRWEACPKCRRRMEEYGITSPGALQSRITERLTKMLAERGKTAIGWDEALENTESITLPKELVIMSWRGREGGERAVRLGHRVIMTPNSEGCYLDYKHGGDPEEPGQIAAAPLEQSYRTDPVSPEMDEAEAALVMGGQGNLWSELIYAGKFAEYMIFPRICAIAEALWTPRKTKNFADFERRLSVHQTRLDRLHILYHREA
jgi:hexosaminidase